MTYQPFTMQTATLTDKKTGVTVTFVFYNVADAWAIELTNEVRKELRTGLKGDARTLNLRDVQMIGGTHTKIIRPNVVYKFLGGRPERAKALAAFERLMKRSDKLVSKRREERYEAVKKAKEAANLSEALV